MTKALTVALMMAVLAACSSSTTPTTEPVAFAGTLLRQDDRILLMDCERRAMTLHGALRDSALARWNGRGQMPNNTGLWLHVVADDSTFTNGRVTQASTQPPCQRAIAGTFAQEADKNGAFPAKVGLQEDGNFSMAVVPPGTDRIDLSGTWSLDGDKVLLKGIDKEMALEVVGPDELLLSDSTIFGATLRFTRR
jgi:hypothetical protein